MLAQVRFQLETWLLAIPALSLSFLETKWLCKGFLRQGVSQQSDHHRLLILLPNSFHSFPLNCVMILMGVFHTQQLCFCLQSFHLLLFVAFPTQFLFLSWPSLWGRKGNGTRDEREQVQALLQLWMRTPREGSFCKVRTGPMSVSCGAERNWAIMVREKET